MSNAIDPRGWTRNFGITTTLKQNDVDLPPQPALDFQGDGVTLSTDAANGKTIATVAGGTTVSKQVDGASAPITKGYGVMQKNGKVTLASASALGASLYIAGLVIAAASANATAPLITHGPVDPTVFNVGAGIACAVGLDTNGAPVRVTDVACVTKRKFVGSCDVNGAIYVNPSYSDVLDAVAYGADASGTNLNDVTFAALLRTATSGDTIRIPPGVYRYTKTIDLNGLAGVTLRGGGASHTTLYKGTVLQYEGLGDGVRQGRSQQMNAVCCDLVIRCTNPGNQAPKRESPSIELPGTISSIVSSSGLILVTMSTAHGLADGNLVCLDAVTGTTEANDGWSVTVTSPTAFTLDGSAFVHAYTGGGRVRTRCGAGLVAIQCSQFTWRNVYCTGFGVGFMLDGGQNASIRDCQADGYEGNDGLGSNSKRFQCAIWLTDGDSGCAGFTVQGATNVIVVDTLNTNGCRLGAQIDGCAAVQFRNMRSTNIGGAGLLNTAITGTASAAGLIKITAVAHGLLTGDWAGINSVGGTTEANGEWQITKIDADHFTLDGSTFANAWTSGGVVVGNAPSALARINRANALCFDTSYSEGVGDAMYIFERQSGADSATQSENVSFRNCFAAGNCAAILVTGAKYGSHNAVTAADLTLLGNQWATKQCIGGGQVTHCYTQIGDKFTDDFASPGQDFWDQDLAAANGVRSFVNQNKSLYTQGVGTHESDAHWGITVEDFATSLLRVSDLNPAFYLDFFVNSRSSTSWKRFVNSPGFGDKSGVEHDVRSASLLQNASLTTIGTSDTIPPKSNTLVEIHVVAHDDGLTGGTGEDETNGSYWIYRALLGTSAGGTLALIGSPALVDSHVGTGFPATLTIDVNGNTVRARAVGSTVADSTWQTNITLEHSQRAR